MPPKRSMVFSAQPVMCSAFRTSTTVPSTVAPPPEIRFAASSIDARLLDEIETSAPSRASASATA